MVCRGMGHVHTSVSTEGHLLLHADGRRQGVLEGDDPEHGLHAGHHPQEGPCKAAHADEKPCTHEQTVATMVNAIHAAGEHP